MTPIDRSQFRISEEAALWLIRLREEDSEALQAQFAAWSRQSPQHVEEFLFAKATFEHLDRIDPERLIDLDTLDSQAADGSVVRLEEHAHVRAALPGGETVVREPRGRMPKRWFAAVAACVLAVCGLSLYLVLDTDHSRIYVTAKGDQMTVKLSDGSVLYLNTSSRAQVQFSERARNVRLLEGEALFVVERDAKRPFQVMTEGAAIKALGTQFNVYRRSDGTRVSVVEGAVRIAPETEAGGSTLDLTAGNEASVVRGRVIRAGKPNVQRAVAWRARRLMFQSDALQDVVREFNRYESRKPIRLEGDGIREREVSGVFDADDPRPLIEFLKADPELSITQSDNEVVIRRK